MASTTRRRRSRDFSPDLSELMNKLTEHTVSFIREFDSNEHRMRQIVGEFREIGDEVRKMQKRTDEVRRAGADVLEVSALGMPFGLRAGRAAAGAAGGAGAAVAAGAVAAGSGAAGSGAAVAGAGGAGAAGSGAAVAAGAGSGAAAGAGGAGAAVAAVAGSGAAGAAVAAGAGAAGAAVAAGSGAAGAAVAAGAAAAAVIVTVGTIGAVTAAAAAIFVAGVNVKKGILETVHVNKVKELGNDFLEIVEPLKIDLEEIKRTCEKLEQRSAEVQAGIILTDMEEFRRILSELGRSDGVLSDMWKVFRVTATPEEDRKLRDSIIQSADLCQKVIADLEKMKEELKDFTEQ